MPTRYCLVPKSQRVDVDLAIFQSALPPSIVLEEERGAVYATVDSTESEDSDTQPLIDRELDRLFFMTSVRLRAEMCRKTVTATLKGSWSLTKAYLEFLGLPLVMSNRVHPQWVEKITKRVDILKKEAWQVLQRAL